MSFKKFQNKATFVLICLTMVLTLVIPASAEEPAKRGIDAILLIDTSGSMRGSDRPRNSIEATKMFIDMMELKTSRIAIIGFNDEVTGITDMTEVNTQKDKDTMKSIVDGFQYDGYTDIGMSLKRAVTMMLGETDKKNSPMILFLTDGVIDIDPENTEGRTSGASYDEVAETLALSGANIPIYTIGLNHNDSVDKEMLEGISSATKGRNYIINEADKLPQIFNEIFADHIKSTLFEIASFKADGETYADVTIDIDNDFVAEANIIMLTEKEIADVLLFDPDGKEAEFDQNDISLSKSNKYSMIKVISPKKGKWLLKTKGVKNDTIRVNLIYQYNVDVEMAASQEEMQNGLYEPSSTIRVTGNLVVNGERTTDSDLYNSVASTLVVTDTTGKIIEEIPLEPVDDGFDIEYTPKADDDISLRIRVESDDFEKESVPAQIEFVKPEEVASDNPENDKPADTEAPETVSMPAGTIRTITITAVILLVILAAAVMLLIKGGKPVFFDGYIEVRAKDGKGKYTSLETPALSTYVKKVTLHEFITGSCLKSGLVEKVLKQSLNPEMIYFYPGKFKNRNVIYLVNNTSTVITDENGNKREDKKIIWQPDEKIIIKEKDDSIATLEMTYRKTEEI